MKKKLHDEIPPPEMQSNNQLAMYDPNQYIINNYLNEEGQGPTTM